MNTKPMHMSRTAALKWCVVFLALAALVFAANANELDRLLSDIEQCAQQRREAPRKLAEGVAERIEKHATNVSAFLLKKLAEPGADEEKLAVYIGILALTKDSNAVPPLTNFYTQTKSETLKEGCFASLAFIGGEQAGQFLLLALKQELDIKRRFRFLNSLAQTQDESVLPHTLEVLESDPKQQYWRSVFVFGKMGDKAVPFLIEKVSHTNRNVRFNAVNVLGQWMFAPESFNALQQQFWKETDEELRGLLLSSATRVSHGTNVTGFLEEVVKKGKGTELVDAAKRALQNLPVQEKQFLKFKKERKASAKAFKKQYDLLYKSFGRDGDRELLARASALSDEPALKKLRERILQRDNDEAFNDYQGVSTVIWMNRLLADMK